MRSLIIDGIDTFNDWGLVLSSKELKPPSPKFYTVDIPGGNGKLNLTTALSGDTVYNNRTQEFVFTVLNPAVSFEGLKTKVSNYLHGREFDYKLSWDDGYTYHGWFSVDKYGTDGILNKITVTIDADPFKYKKTQVYRINAIGGTNLLLESGRKRVQPTIETDGYLKVIYKGEVIELQQGSWKLNDMIFKNGVNEVYLCSYDIRNLTWDDLKGDGLPIKSLGAGDTVVWNQLANITDIQPVRCTATKSGKKININSTNSGTSCGVYWYSDIAIPSGHVVFTCMDVSVPHETTIRFGVEDMGLNERVQAGNTSVGKISTVETEISEDVAFIAYADVTGDDWEIGDTFSFDNLSIIDLTKMFGAGNEPTSITDERIKIISTYAKSNQAYNAGEEISTLGATWGDFKKKPLFEWYKSNGNGTQLNKTWNDLGGLSWDDLGNTTWAEMFYITNYIDTVNDCYIAYEWGDL